MFKTISLARLFACALACASLAACSHDDDHAAGAASNVPASAPVVNTTTTSDVQQWAAQQTAAAVPMPVSRPAGPDSPVSASEPLLPPVIHAVE